MEKGRQRWPSRMIFVFAAIGSSVGLGNIWRFPYLVGKFGGGAFLIPYFILMLLLGVPLLILEFGVGQRMQCGVVGAFRRLRQKASGVGIAAILCAFVVSCYYAVVLSWSLLYFVHSIWLSWGSHTKEFFFEHILHVSSGPGEMGQIPIDVLVGLMVIWVLVYFTLWKGIKSVSKVVAITMPLPVILLIVLLARSITLDGAMDGIAYFFEADFTKLWDFEVWMAAMTQVFFSLTLGFGVMVAYGSYQEKKSDIVKNAIITALSDVGIAMLAGLVIFTTLGHMANDQGVDLAELAASGPSLAFIVLPQALNLIPAAPFFAALFFLTLITLGIDSLFSLVESITSVFSDRFPSVSKENLVLYLCLLCFTGGIVFTTAGGIFYLDIADHFITTYGLVSVAFFEAIVIGWMIDIQEFRSWISSVSDWQIGRLWDGLIRFFTPIALGILLLFSLFRDTSRPYENYPEWALISMGWCMLLGVALMSGGYSLYRNGSNKKFGA